MRELRAKTNKQVAKEDTTVDDDSSGNTQALFNATSERLKRLENESQSLEHGIKNIQTAAKNLTDLQLKV